MTYTVVNLKTTKMGIRCDRASVLGNPFDLRNESERDAVIQAYRKYLWEVVHTWEDPVNSATHIAMDKGLAIASKWKRPTREALVMELQRIEEMQSATLLCWCAPKACHCDVIVRYLDWWKGQKAG